MHSHVSILEHGRQTYIKEMSKQACERLHHEGILQVSASRHLTNILPTGTSRMEATLAGRLDANGKCEGEFYDDRYGQWSSVVVQAVIKVTLTTEEVTVKLNSDLVVFKNGLTCQLSKLTCFDEEGGNSFWNDVPNHPCDFANYDVLYEGQASRITEKDLHRNLTVYSLTSDDVTFALIKTVEKQICGYTLFKTEHPKLFIFETSPGNIFKKPQPISVANIDIFTYINSKFVYVEKHIRTQLTSLYHDLVKQRCELETQVLRHALTLATLSPDEFAYNLAKEPGHMAIIAGEVVHIVKCIPINVRIRETPNCYAELPVEARNESFFLTPKSKLLVKNGMERECDRILAPMYKIDGRWYKLTPHAIESLPPQTLEPNDKVTWTYTQPHALSTSGVYRQSDVDRLKDHILFPTERMAILNNIARGATGHVITTDDITLYNLFNEDTLNKIATSTSRKVWTGFITFGSATAGIMGIFIIIRLIKFIIDTLIHGYTLHQIYGWSVRLLGSLWTSVTHLLVYLGHKSQQEDNSKPAGIDLEIQKPTSNENQQPPPELPTIEELEQRIQRRLNEHHGCIV